MSTGLLWNEKKSEIASVTLFIYIWNFFTVENSQYRQAPSSTLFDLRNRWVNPNPISFKDSKAFGEQTFVKMIQSCHQDIRLAHIIVVSRGGQGAFSPPKSINGTRGLDDSQH